MVETFASDRFAVAVSVRETYKVGVGVTAQENERVLYYYVEKTPEAGVQVQALNANSVPSGVKTEISDQEFLEKYKPEPLIYYNTVKPRMEAMQADLDKGEKHLEAGRVEKAEKSFQKALEYDAENLRAIFGLGNTYLTAGKMEEAKEVFEKIMSIDLAFGPENKFLFNEFGIRMRKNGMLSMAKAYYEKALTATAADENLLFNLGRVYFELGEFPAAIKAAEQSLAANPDFLIAGKLKKAAEKAAQAEGTVPFATSSPSGDGGGEPPAPKA
jgi:tetratricopeptide (TPR) repeat protein